MTIVLLIDNDSKDCPFSIFTNDKAEMSNEILSKQTMNYKIKMNHETRIDAVYEIPIIVKDNNHERLYNKLLIRVSYSNPKIESDTVEIYLAPIALKAIAKERFSLLVRNFKESTTIHGKICTPQNNKLHHVLIIFPNGNAIKADCS